MKTNAKEHPASKEALLDTYKAHIAEMKPKLPELFGRLPKAPLEVLPVPAYIEKDQAAAYYSQGTPDGSRPGRVYINTYHFADRSLAPVEAVSYHEGIPGHHLQIAIAQELTGLPDFRRYTYYTAYTEAGDSTANASAKRLASTRTLIATTDGWRPTSGGRSGW